ncbi:MULTISPECIES: hypothetical protein [unclassified Pseudomonas]|uniref:hypothetical protein n=1 Tax=unclassified Pseudomonas TaxID=196821 RepID=UPI001CC03C05|nr:MULTISPECIES: hypothetical protein [unclassified Pseudomonas]
MIQKKAMGSFNCSFMNIDVREKTLGKIFLVIECHFFRLVVFYFAFICGALGIKWCCKD